MKWLIASVAVFILGFFNLFAPIRGGMQYVFNPIQFGIQQSAVSLRDWSDFFLNLQKIRRKNLDLMEKNQALKSQVVELTQLEEENKLLREQLGVGSSQNDRKLVMADALGNINDKTDTSLVLNKGSSHGISEDDIVIKGNYLLGIVKEVNQFRSKVELVTSPSLLISVTDLQTGVEGIVKGQFGTSLVVNRVLPEDEVNVGDIFVTSGRDGIVPPGYIVGEVSKVSEDSAEVLQNVSMDVLIDFNNISKVFVLLGNSNDK